MRVRHAALLALVLIGQGAWTADTPQPIFPGVLNGPENNAAENPPEEIEPAHFHHVHLNVTDPAKSLRFYEFMFGAIQVRFRGVSDALFTERCRDSSMARLFSRIDSRFLSPSSLKVTRA